MHEIILITWSYGDSSKLLPWLKAFIKPVSYGPDGQYFRQNFDTGQYFLFRPVPSGHKWLSILEKCRYIP